MVELFGMLLHGVNIVLLTVLLYIYVQNYRHLKAKITIGLILFASLFLIQSIMNLYYDTAMVMYSSSSAEWIAMVLEGIKTVAFAVMVWISWE